MTNVWFTADLHLDHKRVAELRGFDSIEAHNEHIMTNLLARVLPGETLWILGDLAVGNKRKQIEAIEYIADTFADRDNSLHLILGNHDMGSSYHRNSYKNLHHYYDVFDSVQTFARKRIKDHNIWISHYPWHGDNDRYEAIKINDDGGWIIHGHTHQSNFVNKEKRTVHVGLEGHDLFPVSYDTIIKEMQACSNH